ncbi:unnamed protein product [Alopecurus aequalis]
MGSRTRSSSSKKSGASPSASAFLVVPWLLILLDCSPCEGRKLLVVDQEQDTKVMHFEGELVLTVSPTTGGKAAAGAPRGFSRAERSMQSVPSPGIGH